ncbi:uncharacterized protein LOC143323578 isoform X2 [Chaetodon auriga]|uniref:uncharacterized protein LOC143323578 isoform X2 n=1 Tax=Chaetodon auriga TaxID=39042 RepID=UPI004032C3EA
MASPCNPQYFQNQSLSLWLLALVFTLTWCFSVSESHAQIQLTGEVGGNVTIHCPYDKHRTIQFFYFQKGDIFVNGYYDSRNIRETGIWNNTRVDHGKATVHMTNLNISHIGTYKCHIMYKNSASPSDTDIHLSLTGTPKDPPEFNHYNHYAIAIAISAVVVFSIMVASLVWWQYKKGKTGVASVDVRQEWKADGYDEEAAKLSEQNEGEQAS